MRILLDTDVLLDVALAREPFAAYSTDVLRWAEAGGAAAMAWHSLANCAYLLKSGGRPFLKRLLRLVTVATADARRALDPARARRRGCVSGSRRAGLADGLPSLAGASATRGLSQARRHLIRMDASGPSTRHP